MRTLRSMKLCWIPVAETVFVRFSDDWSGFEFLECKWVARMWIWRHSHRFLDSSKRFFSELPIWKRSIRAQKTAKRDWLLRVSVRAWSAAVLEPPSSNSELKSDTNINGMNEVGTAWLRVEWPCDGQVLSAFRRHLCFSCDDMLHALCSTEIQSADHIANWCRT